MADTAIEQKPLIETIADYLTNDDWQFDREGEGGNAIQTYVQGQRATYRMRFVANEETSMVSLLLFGPTQAPEEFHPQVLELLNLVNTRYMIGNFELNVARREVCFRVGYDLEGGILSNQMIRNLIGSCISAFDRFFPALMAVCYAGASPASALVSTEGRTSEKAES